MLFWIQEHTRFVFEWDEGNRTKSAVKHKVSLEEAESVFKIGLALPLGVQISPKVAEERLGMVGPPNTGRLLQIAFVLREGRVRVISVRPAHRKEKKQYEEVLRKIAERI